MPAGIIVVAAAAGILGWWLFVRQTVDPVRVTAHRWERVIVLERFDGSAWKPVYEVKEKGEGTAGMAWPTNVPATDIAATPGATRPGARIELLFLELGALGKCKVSDAVWRKYEDGTVVPDTVRARAGKLTCTAL